MRLKKTFLSNMRLYIIKSFFWLAGTRFGAEIGSLSRLVLFVRANDDPYGEFQFSTVSWYRADVQHRMTFVCISCYLQVSQSLTVSESSDGSTHVELTVERSPGTFGRVTVDYQVHIFIHFPV